jgi:hypothetical protein
MAGVGGWMGPERSLGGLSRTFGLRNQNYGGDSERPPRLDGAQL